ncbi:hypothetical protein ACRAWF_22950 [Streptomyces sp. L7]
MGPSTLAINGVTYARDGRVPYVVPLPLETLEIPVIMAQYARAGANARRAGLGGAEIHAANGYLIDQFLQDNANQSTDRLWRRPQSGASAPGGRTGGVERDRRRPGGRSASPRQSPPGDDRLGPTGPLRSCLPASRRGGHRLSAPLRARHLRCGRRRTRTHVGLRLGPRALLRQHYLRRRPRRRIGSEAVVSRGHADAVPFGRAYIANPELPTRIEAGAPLTEPHNATFYTEGGKGYIDYPTLAESADA